MSSFTTPLQLEYLDGRTWRLLAPFAYQLGELGGPESVRVPVDFVTDFASIPRGLWNVFPPTGSYGKAAVVHDWLYQFRLVTVQPDGARYVTRREADGIFNEAMTTLGVRRLTRWLVYTGVRAGGFVVWRQHRQAEVLVPKPTEMMKEG
jgi:hypothetical protein